MVTTPIAHWADEMMIRLPGATTEAAKQAFRGAFVEFCTTTGSWIRECAPMDAVADQKKYTVNPGTDAQVVYILAVSWDNPDSTSGARRKFLRAMQNPDRGRRVNATTQSPYGFMGSFEKQGEFELLPTVSVDVPDALTPWVALRPPVGVAFDEVPEFVTLPFYEQLLDGACARMMIQQGKPYSNQTGAMYHSRRFRAGMAEARDIARRQFTSAEADFVFPYWAGRGNRFRY